MALEYQVCDANTTLSNLGRRTTAICLAMSEGASNGARPFDIDWRAAGIKDGLENLAQHHHQSVPHSSLLLPFICLVKMFSKVFGIATLALATLANASPLARRGVSVDPAKVCRPAALGRTGIILTTPAVVHALVGWHAVPRLVEGRPHDPAARQVRASSNALTASPIDHISASTT